MLVGAAHFLNSATEGFAFVLDLSERKRAEERQKLLLDELNHRVKNTLAIVLAIVAQTSRTATTPQAFHEDLGARLVALSETHNLLTQTAWQGANLRDLIHTELMPHANGALNRFHFRGQDVHLRPKCAVTLGLVFHELATNAAKYGALSVPNGQVRVAWEVDAEAATLHIEWQELGGPHVHVPSRQGFGLRLIERGLGREFPRQVKLEFRSEGVHCSMNLPLDRIDARDEIAPSK